MSQVQHPATQVIIALGGNVGNVAATIGRSLDALDAHPEVQVASRSRLYKTSPVGKNSGGPYLNSAATLDTSLSPTDLLDVLQKIEFNEGRERTFRWSPRPIDLDIIRFGDQVIQNDRLTIPHTACFYRRFVLDPVVEIAGNVVHPGIGKTFGELRQKLMQRPVVVDIGKALQLKAQLGGMFDDRLIRFVENQQDATLAIEVGGSTSTVPHMIHLSSRSEPGNQLLQILIAVTDEPAPV